VLQIKITSDLRKLEKRFKGIISGAFSRERMDAYAMFLANLIKKRTRLGYGVKEEGADKQKLAALSKPYIKIRKDSRKNLRGVLSSETSPSKSNLTFTGQLLNAILGRNKGIGKGEVYIKEQRNDGVKNSDIVEGQEKKQGRPFFYISKLEKQQLKNAAAKDLRDYIKKQFK